MKRRDIGEAVIRSVSYPDTGHFEIPEDGQTGVVKHAVEGQKVKFRVFKNKHGHLHAYLLEVTQPSPLEIRESACAHFGRCGGCLLQKVPYEKQLEMKLAQIRELLAPVLSEDTVCDGIAASPSEFGYRNKLDLSFGDEEIGGPLNIGMHRMRTSYCVLDAETCALAHRDLTRISACIRDYCREKELPFYNKLSHTGYLRYLMLRRSHATGEILVVLAASTQMSHDFSPMLERLLALPLEGSIAGIYLADDDRFGDALLPDELHCLHGRDYFYEQLFDLKFKVTLFSFFQTNTPGAEILYDTVRQYVRSSGGRGAEGRDAEGRIAEGRDADGQEKLPVLYDLYCGTGTIGQVMASEASKVYGIELVPEAAEAAAANAEMNGIGNCRFIAGDVGQLLAEIPERPDYVILDPPREGIHPAALEQLTVYDIDHMVYVSCKASSFVRDMGFLKEHGWKVERYRLVDLFPQTPHVETIVLLQKLNS